MRLDKKLWFPIFALVACIFCFSSETSARTYQWDDYSKPFSQKIGLRETQTQTVEINFPQFVIAQHEMIFLKIRHSSWLGRSGSGRKRWLLLSVNEKSTNAEYKIGFDMPATDKPVKTEIKTKDLSAGSNTFRFKLEGKLAWFGNSFTIFELSFELPGSEDTDFSGAEKDASAEERGKTYRWDDYSEPLKGDIRFGAKEEIFEVSIPQSIIEEYKGLALIVKHNRLGYSTFGSGYRRWLLLAINNEPMQDSPRYAYSQRLSDNPLQIMLDTAKLKPGINRFRIKASETGVASGRFRLYELRFDLDASIKSGAIIADKSHSKDEDAKVYKWEDYSKTFKSKINIIRGMQTKVEIFLPESILRKHDKLQLTVKHSGIGRQKMHSTPWRGLLSINNRSLINSYRFGGLDFSKEPVRIEIDREDLKSGNNIFYFSATGRQSYTITELAFDIPETTIAESSTATQPTQVGKDSQQVKNLSIKETEEVTPVIATQETMDKQAGVVGTRWALVVGVSEYGDTRIPSLRYAARDASSFYDWLISPKGGRYAPARVKLLIDKEATVQNIKNALYVWLGQAIEEDIITLYFACHGSPQSPDTPENLFLLPYDTQYDNIATTGFPMWDIETALKRFIKAKRVIVITDACHAGGVGQTFDVARRDSRGLKKVPISSSLQSLSHIGDGICIITASDDDQFSQESQKWGGGHGVFTYFLLKGLQGEADYSKDNRVSLGEIIPYLSEQVRRATRNAQTPTVAGRFDPALAIGK